MWAKPISQNLRIKLDKRLKSDLRGKKKEISAEKKTNKQREGKERSSNFSLQSMEFGYSVFIGPRTKAHLLDEGYVWVPKTRDFPRDSSEEFGKSKISGLESVNGTS